MTYDQINKRAEELFRECGGLPIEWGAVDECVRTHYRLMAEREIKQPSPPATDPAPSPQEPKSFAPPVQKSACD